MLIINDDMVNPCRRQDFNQLLGKETMDTLGGFKMFAKFYDYATSLPHHLHPIEKYARAVGMNQKPESYYFPIELNAIT